MNLDETQTKRVREWIDQGLKVAEIQTLLDKELGLRLTYMEARLLLDDLKLRPKDPPPAAKPPPSNLAAPSMPEAKGAAPAAVQPATPPKPGGGVSVSVDDIARPGALVSGKVTFRDGQAADWQLDQYGRLAVVPKKQGYKPAQAEVVEFQTELDSVLSRLGF